MNYETWRVSYQSSEGAAKAAYEKVCELQSRIEALEQDNENLRAINEEQDKALAELENSYREELDKVSERNYYLHKENQSLEKDAARLDWLEKGCSDKVFRPYTSNTDYVKFEWNAWNGDMRDNIDTAMQHKKEGCDD